MEHIFKSSFYGHLNGQTKSKKLGPRGVLEQKKKIQQSLLGH